MVRLRPEGERLIVAAWLLSWPVFFHGREGPSSKLVPRSFISLCRCTVGLLTRIAMTESVSSCTVVSWPEATTYVSSRA